MNNTDGSSNLNLNSTKSAVRPSHEAIESDGTESQLDKDAMESAKRAQKRLHNNEETTPGNTIFSK